MATHTAAPFYAAAKHASANTLVVSQDAEDLHGHWLRCADANWLRQVALPMRCCAKSRYRQADQACTVRKAVRGELLVQFDAPQRALTPGQFVAFYQDDELLGGARIEAAEGLASRTAAPAR